MGQIPTYRTFEEKSKNFADEKRFHRIDTVEQFEVWYSELTRRLKDNPSESNRSNLKRINTDNIFRGMGEAKHKLFTSAQRFWITNELEQWWRPKRYLEFVSVFVEEARKKALFREVFEYYNIKYNQRDFPILSILQHYGAPTPLMDFTYSIDVALFFATENAQPSYSSNEIDHYFSIYNIDKKKQRHKEFNNLIDWNSGSFPQISSFFGWEDNKNSIFYISDFEDKKIPVNSFKDERPITTLYNQNIIPQSGLFIFNPFPQKSIEDCFNTDHYQDGNNLELVPFSCINIRKDLGEYIRRKIKKNDIDTKFIYPDLRSDCKILVDEFLNKSVNKEYL